MQLEKEDQESINLAKQMVKDPEMRELMFKKMLENKIGSSRVRI